MSGTIPPERIPLEPANELEGVMVQVASGTRDESAFSQRLFDSQLLVPQTGPPGDLAELPAEPGAELGLPILPAHGRRCVPVYSSEAQMRKAAPVEWTRFVRLGTPALQTMLDGTDAHLLFNPGGDLSTLLDPVQIAGLPHHHPPAERVHAGTPARVLRPEDLPDELSSRLRSFGASNPEIRAAYAAEVDGRLVVGLLVEPGASGAAVARAAEAELASGPPFGLLVIDESAPGGVGAAMLAGEPFYAR